MNKKTYRTCALYLVFVILFTSISWKGLLLVRTPAGIDRTSYEVKTGEQYAELRNDIPFHDIINNNEQTDWEFILNDGLFFSDFELMNMSADTLCELRSKYYSSLSTPLSIFLSRVKQDELYQLIHKFYGTGILPETDSTLEQIEARTLPLEERMNTPIVDIKAETYIRAIKCQESATPSGDMLYQTARAADDTVKILAENGGSQMEILFFSYLAVNFYLLSLPYEKELISNTSVYYYIAKIYLHLYKYSGYTLSDLYSEHFLLSAEAYLQLAVDLYLNANADVDLDAKSYTEGNSGIFGAMPEFAYDYACILDSFLSVYDCSSKETVDNCVKYAKAHIIYYGLEGRYYTDCLKLIGKYSDETDVSQIIQ